MSEFISGNIFIRPNNHRGIGFITHRHKHNFDHTTFATQGWWLVRAIGPEGQEVIEHFCSQEYTLLRAMQIKYEPQNVLRPIRFADNKETVDGLIRNEFNLKFIGLGVDVPEGGKEIEFIPSVAHRLIQADWLHEFALLSEGDGEFSCVYSHRTSQGEISQTSTGWNKPYL